MSQEYDFDLVVVGAGPGGYVAAIRAGQVGLKTALIEKESIGGMCLNWGCIPIKALMATARLYDRIRDARTFGITGIDPAHVAISWPLAQERMFRVVHQLQAGINYLISKNSITLIKAEARITSPTSVRAGDKTLTAENIIISTGSVPEKLDGPVPPELLLEIRDLFQLKTLPESLCVYGQGPNAMELAELLRMLDLPVTMVCPGEHIIAIADPVLSEFAEKKFRQIGGRLLVNSRITGAYDGGVLAGNGKNGDEKIPCTRVLNSSHRRAVLPPMDIHLELENGFIKTNQCLKTNYENIYAVGDVNGRGILAHMASDQGIKAVNSIKGIQDVLDIRHIPLNIYTHPEISQVGLTEPEVKERGIDYKISQFPLFANGKALAEGTTEGFIRLISGTKYGEILGVQIVAVHATDMIAEAGAIMTMEGTIYDLMNILHAHPTVSEIYTEVGYVAVGSPLHV